jgi:hypothetical protein
VKDGDVMHSLDLTCNKFSNKVESLKVQ